MKLQAIVDAFKKGEIYELGIQCYDYICIYSLLCGANNILAVCSIVEYVHLHMLHDDPILFTSVLRGLL